MRIRRKAQVASLNLGGCKCLTSDSGHPGRAVEHFEHAVRWEAGQLHLDRRGRVIHITDAKARPINDHRRILGAADRATSDSWSIIDRHNIDRHGGRIDTTIAISDRVGEGIRTEEVRVRRIDRVARDRIDRHGTVAALGDCRHGERITIRIDIVATNRHDDCGVFVGRNRVIHRIRIIVDDLGHLSAATDHHVLETTTRARRQADRDVEILGRLRVDVIEGRYIEGRAGAAGRDRHRGRHAHDVTRHRVDVRERHVQRQVRRRGLIDAHRVGGVVAFGHRTRTTQGDGRGVLGSRRIVATGLVVDGGGDT